METCAYCQHFNFRQLFNCGFLTNRFSGRKPYKCCQFDQKTARLCTVPAEYSKSTYLILFCRCLIVVYMKSVGVRLKLSIKYMWSYNIRICFTWMVHGIQLSRALKHNRSMKIGNIPERDGKIPRFFHTTKTGNEFPVFPVCWNLYYVSISFCFSFHAPWLQTAKCMSQTPKKCSHSTVESIVPPVFVIGYL